MRRSIPRIDYGILSRKRTTRILILGPYKPKVAKTRLVKLTKSLRAAGYSKTSLTSNLHFRKRRVGETVETYFWQKSRSFLENWAEAALFVLLCGANNHGVMTEFDFTQYKLTNLLLRTSTLLVDQTCPFFSLTTKGNINTSGVNQRSFSTDESLFTVARAECRIHVMTLGKYLR